MSRIGKMPVDIPAGVTVKIGQENLVQVKGPKGTLENKFHPNMLIKIEGNSIIVERQTEEKLDRSLHGLTRSLIFNMVEGVTKGYEKKLEIAGVGYRASKNGNTLVLNIGFSHPIEIEEPEGITIEVPAANQIIVKGIDKQLVGESAAIIRSKRKPEPYKGKGIKYSGELIRRKEGKSGSKK